jgi:hypothetical protein
MRCFLPSVVQSAIQSFPSKRRLAPHAERSTQESDGLEISECGLGVDTFVSIAKPKSTNGED